MRIAFVAPFYGSRAAGGAESECRQTAERLAAAGVKVDVLTTCLLDLHHDWRVNVHSEGIREEKGVRVIRFRAETLDWRPFVSLNSRLLAGETLSESEERQFIALHINSFGLYRHLAKQASRYARVIFIPYLFGTTYHGLQLCAERSILIPCLHDEPYARLRIFQTLFQRARRILYHSAAEQRLGQALYGPDAGRGLLLGEGVQTAFESDGARFLRRYGVEPPFVLYVGRKDAAKNVPALVRDFCAWQRTGKTKARLVLIGPESVTVPPGAEKYVLDLGFLPEQDKKDAYSAAAVLCQPSMNESFSLALMEGWCCGRPALVHGRCAVTREHVVAAKGGLYYENTAEFGAMLDYLFSHPETAQAMGEAGRCYVRRHFDWPVIIRRWQKEVLSPSTAP